MRHRLSVIKWLTILASTLTLLACNSGTPGSPEAASQDTALAGEPSLCQDWKWGFNVSIPHIGPLLPELNAAYFLFVVNRVDLKRKLPIGDPPPLPAPGTFPTNMGFRLHGKLPYGRFVSFQVYDAVNKESVSTLYTNGCFCRDKSTGHLCKGSVNDENIVLLNDVAGDAHPYHCGGDHCSTARDYLLWIVPESAAGNWFTYIQSARGDANDRKLLLQNTLVVPDALPLYALAMRLYLGEGKGNPSPCSEADPGEIGGVELPVIEAFDLSVFDPQPDTPCEAVRGIDFLVSLTSYPSLSDLVRKEVPLQPGTCPQVPLSTILSYIFGGGGGEALMRGTVVPKHGRCVEGTCQTYSIGTACSRDTQCAQGDELAFFPFSLLGQGPNASNQYVWADFDRARHGDVAAFRFKVPPSATADDTCTDWEGDGDQAVRYWSWCMGARWGNTSSCFSDNEVQDLVDPEGYLNVVIAERARFPRLRRILNRAGVKAKLFPWGPHLDKMPILYPRGRNGVIFRYMLADDAYPYRPRKVYDEWISNCSAYARSLPAFEPPTYEQCSALDARTLDPGEKEKPGLQERFRCWCGLLDPERLDPDSTRYDPGYYRSVLDSGDFYYSVLDIDKKCQDRCAEYLSVDAPELMADLVPAANADGLMEEYGPTGQYCRWPVDISPGRGFESMRDCLLSVFRP